MNTATSTLSGNDSIANAAGRAHQLVDDVADKAAPAVQSATGKAHETIDIVAGVGKSASDWVSSNGAQVVGKTGAMLESCAVQVRARPLLTLAGAMAIGYLAGRVMR
jgi:hypothetical protein